MVESAIQRPYGGYYPSIAQKCAALVQSVSRNHGFADGNKRTTLLLLHTLLKRSGYKLVSLGNGEDIETAAEQMILDVVTNQLNFRELVLWLKARIRRQ